MRIRSGIQSNDKSHSSIYLGAMKQHIWLTHGQGLGAVGPEKG